MTRAEIESYIYELTDYITLLSRKKDEIEILYNKINKDDELLVDLLSLQSFINDEKFFPRKKK